jgi:intracellular multiplication protein IcmK
MLGIHRLNEFTISTSFKLLALFCLFFASFSLRAEEIPFPSGKAPANAGQFEQWLRKNGYGGTQIAANTPPSPPPGVKPGSEGPPASNKTPAVVAAAVPDPLPPPALPQTLEQQQQSMLDALPPSDPPSEDSEKAFDMLLKQNMPLSNDQVLRLRQQIDLSQRAAAVPPNVPPKPVSTTLMINLAPGSTPPPIRLAQGYVSSLVFVDSTGAAWPIAAYEVGNPKAVNIQWDGKSNILLLQAVSPYSNGNLVIRLANLPTPLTLELISGQRVVDFRVDIHVAGMGPTPKEVASKVSLPAAANNVLLSILDGVPPTGSKTLMVKGGDCQAWLVGDKMYLRTRFTVLSPGWIGKMTSSDGMQAYELPRSASILISRYGEPVELKVEGF